MIGLLRSLLHRREAGGDLKIDYVLNLVFDLEEPRGRYWRERLLHFVEVLLLEFRPLRFQCKNLCHQLVCFLVGYIFIVIDVVLDQADPAVPNLA